MTTFKSSVTDYAAIRKVYAEKLGGSPFGIKPEKPPVKCDCCGTTWYKNGTSDGPGCSGACCY